MDAETQELIDQGYTSDEAALVKHVVETARADREYALRTGMCRCGRKMRKLHSTLECIACGVVHAA